jgi:hypothetical protein
LLVAKVAEDIPVTSTRHQCGSRNELCLPLSSAASPLSLSKSWPLLVFNLFIHRAAASTFHKLLIHWAFCLFLIWGKAKQLEGSLTLAAPSIPAYTFLQKQSFSLLCLLWFSELLYTTGRNSVHNSVAGACKYRRFWLIRDSNHGCRNKSASSM